MARAPRAFFVSIAVALVASVVLCAPAFGSAKDVIRDCSEDGVLNGHYSHSELAKALAQLPSDIDEYTDCRAVIRSAELRSANKGKGSGVSSKVDTVSPPNANEQRRLHDATKSAGEVLVGGKGVTPGALKTAGFGTDLPPLVLAVLLALASAVIAGGALAFRRHRPAFARPDGPLGEPLRKFTSWARNGIDRFRR
jgi:hypothetical protein